MGGSGRRGAGGSSQHGATGGYRNSPAPRRFAEDRERLDGHGGRLDGHGTRLNAIETGNQAQTGSLESLRQRVIDLEALNVVRGEALESLRQRVVDLENFRARALGFAPEMHGDGSHSVLYSRAAHLHPWADLPNNGIHGNDRHDPAFQPR